MSHVSLANLETNERIEGCYLVREKSLAAFRNKPGQYLNISLADCTAELKGRVWDNAEEIAKQFNVGDVVRVIGHVEEYQEKKQLVLRQIEIADPTEYDLADLMKTAGMSPAELQELLTATVAEVQDPWLRALLDDFLADEEFVSRFSTCFGARGIHHAFVGGLLEHTLHVVHLLKATHALYPDLNRDLMIAGGLLHDIGKMVELDASLSPDYTDAGRLIGHTVITDRMIQARIRNIEGFPEHLSQHLTHMILSHHGEREYGAPVVPSTLEACALHHADVMDARVQGFIDVIAQAKSQDANARWSNYNSTYQRRIYTGVEPALPEEEPVETDAQTQNNDAPASSGQLPL